MSKTLSTAIANEALSGWRIEGYNVSYDDEFAQIRVLVSAAAGSSESYEVVIRKTHVLQTWQGERQIREPVNYAQITTKTSKAWTDLKTALEAGQTADNLEAWLTAQKLDPEQFRDVDRT